MSSKKPEAPQASSIAHGANSEIDDVLQRACRELPDGIVVRLCISDGEAYVEYVTPEGDQCVVDCEGSAVEMLTDALVEIESVYV